MADEEKDLDVPEGQPTEAPEAAEEAPSDDASEDEEA